jgi:predicted phage terminase large subunit-like protein
MEAGSYLFEERYGEKELQQDRKDMGEFAFSAQILQEPSSLEGAFFQEGWLNYFIPDTIRDYSKMNIYISVDTSSGLGTDYTVFAVIGLSHDKNVYLLDLVRDKFNGLEISDALIKLHQKWGSITGKNNRVLWEKTSMDTVLLLLRQKMSEIGYNFNITELVQRTDKFKRIITFGNAYFLSRTFYMPFNIPYQNKLGERVDLSKDFINDEYKIFSPATIGVANDDMLDAMANICHPDANVTFPMVLDVNTRKNYTFNKPKSWMG